MKRSAFVFTACLVGVIAACVTSTVIPTIQPTAVSTLTSTFTSTFTPPAPTISPQNHAASSTPHPTPTITPTSLPGQPQLIKPANGAVLPQPVLPNEWIFSWSARTGPCYGAITIEGPGERRLGNDYLDWYTTGYNYTYSTTQYLPDDALGPWHWFVEVICFELRNRSETRTFWVVSANDVAVPTEATDVPPTPCR